MSVKILWEEEYLCRLKISTDYLLVMERQISSFSVEMQSSELFPQVRNPVLPAVMGRVGRWHQR